MTKLIAGIDPGVKTGVALWWTDLKKFKLIETVSIIKAMEIIKNHHHTVCDKIEYLRFEDARLRKWFGKSGREVLQGAGSVKRDCKIWQEFCEYHNIPFQAVAPAKGQTKWDAGKFKKLTGWQRRTSEHARDAALLVWGMR